jgi:multidrug efflux pump subunit AcrB
MNKKTFTRIEELRHQFESGFLGFWIRQYRISYLIVLGLIVLGFVALSAIPKESSPSIKFWIVSVVTVYPWTNPNDIDTLITDKIYKEIKDIKWIDKIDSKSSLWVSAITINLKTNANTKDVINEVRNNVNRVILPSDAKTPVITEINTDTKQAFSIYLYAKNPSTTKSLLMNRAVEIQDAIEAVPGIESVKFNQWYDYDAEIVIDAEKLKATWLTIDTVATAMRSWNRDVPVWNFWVGQKNYDFRIEGKYKEALSFLSIPLNLADGSVITLSDIATLERTYKDKSISTIWLSKSSTLAPFVSLTVNKTDGSNIFTVSDEAKKVVESMFTRGTYKDFWYEYWLDLADNIRDDYKELAREALTTLVLVFIAMYLFVWFRDSLFATVTLPLAFLATFLLLYYGWFTLNFLTNFSLILSFGIAVDTIIVIVQAASAKIRVWYDPRSAIMLALREYAVPVISWVMTTIVVFIPMMALPGILWKFLAYIPITIFWVLASWLVLALTVNSALYLLFVKKSTTYVSDENAIEYAEEDERELLTLEREWKEEIQKAIPLRIRVIHACTSWYKRTLRSFLENTFLRRISIGVPVIVLILSFLLLAPRVWFDLFPWDDNSLLSFKIEWSNGLRPEEMYEQVKKMNTIFSKYPEIRYTTLTTKNNETSVTVQLYKKDERKSKWQMSVFDLEKLLVADFKPYEEAGLKITSEVAKNWPPWAKAVWLKIIARKAEELPTLITVAHDFEKYLKTVPWTKNVSLSSKDTPGQFVFTIKKEALSLYNISPALIYSQVTQMMNGVTVWSIEDNGTDMNIVLRMSNFREKINIEDILTTTFNVWPNTYQLWNFIDYDTKNSIASVERSDGKVQITVDADLETWIDSVSTQSKFAAFAEKYNFPPWISYKAWWENEANKELIVAVLSAFFIALLVIFSILTLQFNSYSQPAVILYSVIMSLPFVMLGLLITGNKFSLPFWIGFIAFTWIAVNHGIILIDAINQNLKKWMEGFTALVEAWSSRLEPMTLTTVTTVLGILPIALRDKFWSWMGFTIIFGIIAASTLTLFVVKWIYFEIYIAPKMRKKRN